MSPEAQEFIETWQQQHGRPLRVLHIGNIANNAYNNAKIQRRNGIDAYVLSFDYYHIMACPEWEDADFRGEIANAMFPDWWSVDLSGFKRPRWFAQGPLDASIRYLLSQTIAGKSANGLWRWLQFERWLLCRNSFANRCAKKLIAVLTNRQVSSGSTPSNTLAMALGGRIATRVARVAGLRSTTLGRQVAHLGRRLTVSARIADMAFQPAPQLQAFKKLGPAVSAVTSRELAAINRDEHFDNLENFYRIWFHPYLSLLLKRFDIVQCYATYTAMPFLLGQTAYFAYEHGTIRSIPFQSTDEGRMCAATYRAAASVFVTNTDNLLAAERLRLEPERTFCLPHAFDSDKLLAFARSTGTRHTGGGGTVALLTPARQHWVDQDPGWAKGNELVFNALRIVKDSGEYCILRAVAWGQDLEASRALIKKLGISDMVEWVPAMKKRELWASYLNSHAVIDQFVVPAMGGVTFEAMMLGRRVVSAIDEEQAARFFGASPPLFNCRTAEQIAEAIQKIVSDPLDAAAAGKANQDWMKTYHSADRIVSIQAQAYKRQLRVSNVPA